MDLAGLAKRAMHADRKVSESKDKGGAWVPWVELRVRRLMACMYVCKYSAAPAHAHTRVKG